MGKTRRNEKTFGPKRKKFKAKDIKNLDTNDSEDINGYYIRKIRPEEACDDGQPHPESNKINLI